MNRRRFLIHSATAALAAASCHAVLADDNKDNNSTTAQTPADSAIAAVVSGELKIDLAGPSHLVPLNYTGFSYELAQLRDPNFFAATNKELIALYKQLSPQGVLRLGGNSSESCWFQYDPSVTAPELRAKSGNAAENWMPSELFKIEPIAIDHLADFLNATGWQVIYGLNFGNSSPERAAKEAEYVASKVGDKLLYFQIGNEPDFYHNANNKTRPANWGFNDYLNEWTDYADAITKLVPNANFGGPDVGSSSNWIPQFAAGESKKLGKRLRTLTGHYYAEGPPDDPKVTTAKLLKNNPSIASRAKQSVDAAAKVDLVYRMTEGNSCYRGGKPGMSDAFASALWGGDYMLALASVGCAGVNLHGGSRNVLRASLGNHMPGELVAKSGSDTKGGYYTPIAGELETGFTARPLLYGMLLANQFTGGKTRPVSLTAEGVNATAYAAEFDQELRVAIFNKDDAHDLQLSLTVPEGYRRAKLWRLTAPALDSTSDVALAGARISADAKWSPVQEEKLSVTGDGALLNVPHASAALVFLDR